MFCDYTLEEIAELVGSTLGGVKAALSRGRSKLATLPEPVTSQREVNPELSRLLHLYVDRFNHSRDIGEPFDFLTWFEYAPQHSEEFDELVRTLRQTEEWRHVEREIDIRLMREPEG